jgi:hypothetical protein
MHPGHGQNQGHKGKQDGGKGAHSLKNTCGPLERKVQHTVFLKILLDASPCQA